jgi:hypothetical protein
MREINVKAYQRADGVRVRAHKRGTGISPSLVMPIDRSWIEDPLELSSATQQYALLNRVPYSDGLKTKVASLIEQGDFTPEGSFDSMLLPKTRFSKEAIEDLVGVLSPEVEQSIRQKAASRGVQNADSGRFEDVYTLYNLICSKTLLPEQQHLIVLFDSTEEISKYLAPGGF